MGRLRASALDENAGTNSSPRRKPLNVENPSLRNLPTLNSCKLTFELSTSGLLSVKLSTNCISARLKLQLSPEHFGTDERV